MAINPIKVLNRANKTLVYSEELLKNSASLKRLSDTKGNVLIAKYEHPKFVEHYYPQMDKLILSEPKPSAIRTQVCVGQGGFESNLLDLSINKDGKVNRVFEFSDKLNDKSFFESLPAKIKRYVNIARNHIED